MDKWKFRRGQLFPVFCGSLSTNVWTRSVSKINYGSTCVSTSTITDCDWRGCCEKGKLLTGSMLRNRLLLNERWYGIIQLVMYFFCGEVTKAAFCRKTSFFPWQYLLVCFLPTTVTPRHWIQVSSSEWWWNWILNVSYTSCICWEVFRGCPLFSSCLGTFSEWEKLLTLRCFQWELDANLFNTLQRILKLQYIS